MCPDMSEKSEAISEGRLAPSSCAICLGVWEEVARLTAPDQRDLKLQQNKVGQYGQAKRS